MLLGVSDLGRVTGSVSKLSSRNKDGANSHDGEPVEKLGEAGRE